MNVIHHDREGELAMFFSYTVTCSLHRLSGAFSALSVSGLRALAKYFIAYSICHPNPLLSLQCPRLGDSREKHGLRGQWHTNLMVASITHSPQAAQNVPAAAGRIGDRDVEEETGGT